MRGRHTLAATIGVLCLLLAACGGSAEPQPLPRPTASLSPSPSATPPAMPAAATAKTRAGAIAAAKHFLEAMEYAGDTGQTRLFEDAYTSECTKCQGISEGIAGTYSKGGSIVGGAWIPKRVKFYSIKGDIATLDIVVDYEPQTLTPEAGAAQTTSPARPNVLKAFQMLWRDGRWRVGALDPEA
jgi:Family of unknown function (DUF6318)